MLASYVKIFLVTHLRGKEVILILSTHSESRNDPPNILKAAHNMHFLADFSRIKIGVEAIQKFMIEEGVMKTEWARNFSTTLWWASPFNTPNCLSAFLFLVIVSQKGPGERDLKSLYSKNDNKARKKGQQSPHSWWMVVQGKAQFLIHIFSSFKGNVRRIRSVWERYHWIGLRKGVNRYRFFFYLEFWKKVQSSELLYKNASNLNILRQTACIEFSSYWLAHFYLMKKMRQSAALFWFGLQDVGIRRLVRRKDLLFCPCTNHLPKKYD